MIEDEETDHLPYWNSVYLNQAFPYVPQLGDKVVYFHRPHFEFLRRNGRKYREKIDYEEDLPNDRPYFEGTIDEIEYIPAEIIKCRIVLKVLIGRSNQRLQFSYFFGVSQPNYLVLKTAYTSNVSSRFRSNETVKIYAPPCSGETGIILEVNDSVDPLQAFGAYKILW